MSTAVPKADRPDDLPPGLGEGPVVLDASYVIALLEGEPAAQAYAELLARAVLPSVTAGEVVYKVHAASGLEPATVEAGLVALGVDLVTLPVAAARHFPALPRHRRRPPRGAARSRGASATGPVAGRPVRPGPRPSHRAAGADRGPALGHAGPPRARRRRSPLPPITRGEVAVATWVVRYTTSIEIAVTVEADDEDTAAERVVGRGRRVRRDGPRRRPGRARLGQPGRDRRRRD